MATSWTPPTPVLSPSLGTSTELSVPSLAPIDLSPVSFAHIHDQRRPLREQILSSSRAAEKLSKHPHRQTRSHRHHPSMHNKRKRPAPRESTSTIKEETSSLMKVDDEESAVDAIDQIKTEETECNKSETSIEGITESVPMMSTDENSAPNMFTTVTSTSDVNDKMEDQIYSSHNTSSTSSRLNRDLLRKNISQHVHTTLKPYTKRTCKQGRIVSTDDIKYLVKKFTLAVLDKEIEKAKNDGIPLSPILTDRVRLKTEVYVKKYMNKVGAVFQRHETTAVHPSSLSQAPASTTSTSTNPDQEVRLPPELV